MDAGTSDDLKVNETEAQAQAQADNGPPPRMPDLPLREDIDAVRDTGQFTPSEIQTHIDRLRPWLYAAGFTAKDVDDYYGIEHFDFDGAIKDCCLRRRRQRILFPVRKSS